ncbi:hypothetical protein HK100_005407 [Physocladia obscura]|uniref:Uncharacterized protein n=1 Tax=Physocladia obscura TaxID=109957 RepID=A0AAD5T6U9_9FUNG|nr:hypothetical protein HK100_005407 [Physocladia obscura]
MIAETILTLVLSIVAVNSQSCNSAFIVGASTNSQPDLTLTPDGGCWLEPFRSPLTGNLCKIEFEVYPQNGSSILPLSASLFLYRANVSDEKIVRGLGISFANATAAIDVAKQKIEFKFCGTTASIVKDEDVTLVFENNDSVNEIVLAFSKKLGAGYLYNSVEVANKGMQYVQLIESSAVFKFYAGSGPASSCYENVTPTSATTAYPATTLAQTMWDSAQDASASSFSTIPTEYDTQPQASTDEQNTSTIATQGEDATTVSNQYSMTTAVVYTTKTAIEQTSDISTSIFQTATTDQTLNVATSSFQAATTDVFTSAPPVTYPQGVFTVGESCIVGDYGCGQNDSNGYATILNCTDGFWALLGSCDESPNTCSYNGDDGMGYCDLPPFNFGQ